LTINPHAEALEVSAHVIRLTDMRPIEIAHSILIVEGNEHFAVTDWNIARHALELSLRSVELKWNDKCEGGKIELEAQRSVTSRSAAHRAL
jgi:hypothetical protein